MLVFPRRRSPPPWSWSAGEIPPSCRTRRPGRSRGRKRSAPTAGTSSMSAGAAIWCRDRAARIVHLQRLPLRPGHGRDDPGQPCRRDGRDHRRWGFHHPGRERGRPVRGLLERGQEPPPRPPVRRGQRRHLPLGPPDRETVLVSHAAGAERRRPAPWPAAAPQRRRPLRGLREPGRELVAGQVDTLEALTFFLYDRPPGPTPWSAGSPARRPRRATAVTPFQRGQEMR